MDRPQLLQHFDTLAETPDVTAKLRSFVLHLATRGKLVSQNSSDERATELVQRTIALGKRIAKEQKLKLPTPETAISEKDKSFPLPEGWAWAKLGDLCIKLGAGSTPLGGKRVYQESGIRFLRSQNVWNGGLDLDAVALIAPAVHKDMDSTCVEPGDVLLNITGASIGRSAIVPDDFDEANVSQHVAIIRLADKSLRQFIHLIVIAPDFQSQIMQVQVGVSREGLSMKNLKEFVIALPPLAEQKRIVAKVEELLALCDELEARQTAAHEHRTRLVRSALDHLTSAKDEQDFRKHSTFVIQNSDLILDSVPALRQSILSLAVQGRLGPVGPRQDAGSPPSNWRSVTVGEIADHRLGKMLDHQKNRGTSRPYLRNTNVHWFRFDLSSIKELRLQDDELENYELRRDDVLICEGGHGIGRTAVWESDETGMIFQKALHRVRPGKHLNGRFFAFCMKVYADTGVLSQYFTGAGIPHLTGQSLARLKFPLPPLVEQKRIVAKVDELMRWCDELEARLTTGQTTASALLDATLKNLLEGKGNGTKQIE